jgi:hypothetical protein
MMSSLKLKKVVAGALLVLLVFVSANGMVPATANAQSGDCSGTSSWFLGFPTWYKYLQPHRTANGCALNFTFPEDLSAVALAVFEILLRVAGIVAVVFVMYGGFLYMTSTGEPDRAANGRTTLTNALVGLLIAMLATAIVNLVGRNIAP